jgi:hypothetical protein
MSFDIGRQKFGLDCDLRQPTDQEATSGVIPIAQLNSYQYLTGPKYLLKQWLDLRVNEESGAHSPRRFSEANRLSPGRSFVLLLKREVDGNIFHNINEVMAIMITVDVPGRYLSVSTRSLSRLG